MLNSILRFREKRQERSVQPSIGRCKGPGIMSGAGLRSDPWGAQPLSFSLQDKALSQTSARPKALISFISSKDPNRMLQQAIDASYFQILI